MERTKSFKGSNVFLSRNLVLPDKFDAVHDSLKQNGAEVFLCCDPSRSGTNDYHVISGPSHDKFEDLLAKGCKLLGTELVISCGKENRALPKNKGFTCCLAMDGVKVLATGFDNNEKGKIEKLVTAMGGVFQTRAASDTDFVICKNVLSGKYKWGLQTLKKPVITINWLYQCWSEHRLVPHEPCRVLPFSGLTICFTRIAADVRKEMENLIVHNGGQYSGDLTRNCTHLISDAPEGDKYRVAQKWGHIRIVTKDWLRDSFNRKVYLPEDAYLVQGITMSANHVLKNELREKNYQDKKSTNSQSGPGPIAADSEATLSQNISSAISDSSVIMKGEEGIEAPPPSKIEDKEETLDSCVADDSQSEDSGLYLSDCRILLVGFHAAEMRKLVNKVRRGGGSRYMAFNDRLTHIVVGTPTENERRELRRYTAAGVIYVVRAVWLDDCDQEKKELPVSKRHVVPDLILPKDSVCPDKATKIGTRQGHNLITPPSVPDHLTQCFRPSMPQEQTEERKTMEASKQESSMVKKNSSNIFRGSVFRFSSSFPLDRRAEIVEWIKQGGGEIVDGQSEFNVNFTVECHGLVTKAGNVSQSQTTIVSTHWIRSCLEDACMPDVGSHIIYSPVPCKIPLPGFEAFRFCVSQYEEKDRLLLRNLCFVLGAKFTEKLSKKVTHLLCKFTNGPKYEAACKWGMQTVTSEWISECIRQNAVVSAHPFRPKEMTAQDREAGLATMSQYTTQAARMISGEDVPSQSQSQSQFAMKSSHTFGKKSTNLSVEAEYPSATYKKRAKVSANNDKIDLLPLDVCANVSSCTMKSIKTSEGGNIRDDGSHDVPDVAAAIEDLLEESSKIQDMALSGRTISDRSIFSPDHSIITQNPATSHSAIQISTSWLSRKEKQDDGNQCDSSSVQGVNEHRTYDGFSETQTESQVVVYEEDLSGRQMMIDRHRTRSSMT